MQSAAGPRDPDRGLLVRPAMRDGQFPSMFVCPACGLRLTATLQEGSATAVRCECQKEFVVKLPLARKNTRQHRLPFQSNDSSSSETESHSSVKSLTSNGSCLSLHSVPSSVLSGRSGKSVKSVLVGTCSSASSAVNVSTVSLSDLDTPIAADGVVAEAIAKLPAAAHTRGATPDSSSRPPRILEDRVRPGEASEEADRSRRKPAGLPNARAAREERASGSLLPFEFPALRAFLGS
mmetsp:Transcript_4175/g.13722  ORF Transcript_4175/g.13722 Transcript_4175/m.13722 type:complete len:236 (-) Transcript_4175:683-1390(-)